MTAQARTEQPLEPARASTERSEVTAQARTDQPQEPARARTDQPQVTAQARTERSEVTAQARAEPPGETTPARTANARGTTARVSPGVSVYRKGEARAVDEGDVFAYREDRVVTARQLAADARAGDEIALRAMRRAGRAIGIAIASATHLCDLDLVTIGGGLSQAGEPLFGPLEEALREHARMGFAQRVKVVPAALGQEAGLVGAAALLLADDTYWPA
ncbi:ROK family protein [Nonomuraea aridisoli]|uniref:ROK family protein n=1 Tax=Nonomuraea aridisoli TaxID=2070368 RepID=UPI001F3B1E35|nr:ROK family protein [Nonomuraea aridisoli]